MDEQIKRFLSVSYGYGDGSGYGYGYSYGYGDGSGDGYGDGYGYGDGSGSGYGDGSGYGYGYGDGSGDGHGDGSGDGHGDGSGDGSGYGYGSGDGSGYSYGYGDGSGSGYGDGLKSYNGQHVYYIDHVPTLIDSVHANFAKGSIINGDLTLRPCYIAKCGNYFAHGDTLAEARSDAEKKYNDNLPVSERIRRFMQRYPSLDTVCPNADLFEWHHTLTGSCRTGRQAFIENHGIRLSGSMTVAEFIHLTINDYGGDIINQLKETYN